MKNLARILLLLGLSLAALSLLKYRGDTQDGATLTVYCAAGLKAPVEEIATQFTKDTGVHVVFQFGGTGTLLSQIRVAKRGDVFIAADQGTIADAQRFGTIREVIPIVTQRPVIAVPTGNPKNIKDLASLLQPGLRVALANPEAASIGRITRRVSGEHWAPLSKQAVVMKPTVTEIASDLSLGAVDAAVVWDSTVPQFKGLEAVHLPEFDAAAEVASAGILTDCKQSTAALQFARYLAAPEKGGPHFARHGFAPSPGDPWAQRPAMVLYSGGVNRPAIEKLLKEFADREGIDIQTVFNGCGILCASMKTMLDTNNPKFPDAYFACDLCFVPPVAEQFPTATLLTETNIGIIVPKGNPKGIHTLADLARPDLRLGLCNAEQSTLGYMTQGMLHSSGLEKSIRAQVAVEVPTADFLVNQMRVGALDAAVVYEVNAALQAQHLDFLPIAHPGARAVQPFAVREKSPNAQLAGRLLAFLKTHREVFEGAGFTWLGEEAILSKDIEIPDWLKAPQ